MGALLKRIVSDKKIHAHVSYEIYEESNNGNPFITYYVRDKILGDSGINGWVIPIEHKEKLLAYRDNSIFHRGNFVREYGKMFIRDGKFLN